MPLASCISSWLLPGTCRGNPGEPGSGPKRNIFFFFFQLAQVATGILHVRDYISFLFISYN